MPRAFKGSKHVLLPGRVQLWLTNATSGKLRCEGWDESSFPFMKRPAGGWPTKVLDSIRSWPILTEDLSIPAYLPKLPVGATTPFVTRVLGAARM